MQETQDTPVFNKVQTETEKVASSLRSEDASSSLFEVGE